MASTSTTQPQRIVYVDAITVDGILVQRHFDLARRECVFSNADQTALERIHRRKERGTLPAGQWQRLYDWFLYVNSYVVVALALEDALHSNVERIFGSMHGPWRSRTRARIAALEALGVEGARDRIVSELAEKVRPHVRDDSSIEEVGAALFAMGDA